MKRTELEIIKRALMCEPGAERTQALAFVNEELEAVEEEEDEREALNERAMQAGMMGGVNAYNDAMGYEVENPETDWGPEDWDRHDQQVEAIADRLRDDVEALFGLDKGQDRGHCVTEGQIIGLLSAEHEHWRKNGIAPKLLRQVLKDLVSEELLHVDHRSTDGNKRWAFGHDEREMPKGGAQ